MLSVCEAYIINVKHNKNKMRYRSEQGSKKVIDTRYWDKLSMAAKLQLKTEKRKIEGVLTEGIAGRAYNAEIVRLTDLSVATITRWRREAEGAGFNAYDLKTISVNGRHTTDTKVIVEDRVKKRSVFSAAKDGKGSLFTRDLVITTNIDIFSVIGRGRMSTKSKKKKLSLCGILVN